MANEHLGCKNLREFLHQLFTVRVSTATVFLEVSQPNANLETKVPEELSGITAQIRNAVVVLCALERTMNPVQFWAKQWIQLSKKLTYEYIPRHLTSS
jgi:hypothetical protein